MSPRCVRRVTEVVYAAGTYLAHPGQLADRFVYVVEGEIEVVNAYTDERHLPSTLGPTQFMGEISFLNGGNFSMPMRAVRDTHGDRGAARGDADVDVANSRDVGHHHHGVLRAPAPADRAARQCAGADRRGASIAMCAASPNSPVAIAFPTARSNSAAPKRMRWPPAVRSSAGRPAVIFGRDTVVADPTPDNVARLLGLEPGAGRRRGFRRADRRRRSGGCRGRGLRRCRRAVRAGDRGHRDRRPGRHRPAGSRTTWGFPPASPAPTWSGAAKSRR